MKFSQMKYERPDAEQLKAELNGLTEKLKAAKSYTEAKELFLAEEKLNKHISRAGPRPCWNLLTVRTLPKSTAT